MTAPRFTPGAWRRLSHRLIVAGEGEQMQPICEVWSGGVGNEEADANEILIAAAPELYRALDDLLNQVKRAAVTKDTFLTGLAASALQAAREGPRKRIQSPVAPIHHQSKEKYHGRHANRSDHA